MAPKVQQLVDSCCSLIEVPSVDDDYSALREIIDRIRRFFDGAPVIVEQVERNGYPSIVITTEKTKSPNCMLHGHVDVVPGNPNQYQPRVINGQLFGRGAVDMKGFVAVAMHVIRDLAFLPNPPNIGLMINTDEEIGGRSGAKILVEEGWHPKKLLNGDGGYGHAVTFAQKGIIQLEIEAQNNPGARNAPWNGESAAELLMRNVTRGLDQLCPRQYELDADTNWGSTACVLDLQSKSDGVGPPCWAQASVRIYWAGEQSGEEVIQLAREAFAPLNVTGLIEGERVYLSPEDPDLLNLREIWERRLERPIGIRADNGSSDAKWFAPLGIPILILRVPGDGAHTDNEWLDISSLQPLYETLCEYLLQSEADHESDQKLRIDPAEKELDLGVPHRPEVEASNQRFSKGT